MVDECFEENVDPMVKWYGLITCLYICDHCNFSERILEIFRSCYIEGHLAVSTNVTRMITGPNFLRKYWNNHTKWRKSLWQ